MSAKYIIRFDDICPTMNWIVWDDIETILAKYNIKPIIAVIPDNRDPKLIVNPPKKDFWERVRAWQEAGWTIGIHGYQHFYCTDYAGLTRINNYSEFAGLSYEEQRAKLEKGLAIFSEYNIRPDAWIAPAHSFDKNTVQALIDLNIKVISDGFYFRPVKRLGALWIPQQLWRFRFMSHGVWTVCLHHNNYTDKKIKEFERDVEKFVSKIVSFNQIIQDYSISEINLLDYSWEAYWHMLIRLKKILWPIVYYMKKIAKNEW